MPSEFKKILVGSVLVGFALVSVFFYVKSLGQDNTTLNSRNRDRRGFSESMTPEEIARHSSPGDCRVIITGNVYDVNSFINEHPGGPERIVPQCGKDATEVFQIQGNTGGSHSADDQCEEIRIRDGSIERNRLCRA